MGVGAERMPPEVKEFKRVELVVLLQLRLRQRSCQKYSPTLLEGSWHVLALNVALKTHDKSFSEQVTAGEIPLAWSPRS